jgi:hypothetical protein
MKNIFGAYRSTLLGLAIAALTTISQGLATPPVNWQAIGLSVAIAVLLALTDVLKEKQRSSKPAGKKKTTTPTTVLVLAVAGTTLLGCSAGRHAYAPVPGNTVERTITVTKTVRDTVLITKADTVRLAAQLVADTATGKIVLKKPISNKQAQGRAAVTARIDEDNNLLVDCYCDTAAILFEYADTHTQDSTVKTVYMPPQLIEKQLNWWQKLQQWAGRIFLLLLLIVLGANIYKLIARRR